MATRRTAKVEELIREELSRLIQMNLSEELGIISVTRVYVSPDLKTSTIFVSAVRDNQEKEILAELKNKAYIFQKELGHKIKMRYTPRLSFEYDRGGTEIDRVEELLEEINRGA
jgi:ribosome-binding factor A